MKILRIPELTKLTGLSRVTLWRLERDGNFPRRVQLSQNTVGWKASEVDEWLESRPRVSTENRGDAE